MGLDQTYNDFFNSFGLCTSVTIILVSIGKLITENYFYYIMFGICIVALVLTIYDRAQQQARALHQPDFLKEYRKSARRKVVDIVDVPCEKAIETLPLGENYGISKTLKARVSPRLSMRRISMRKKSTSSPRTSKRKSVF